MDIPQEFYYTKEHEWVSLSGKVATIGISEYAQSALGDITFIELPKVDAEVEQFEQVASVESVKAASDIYSPLSGTVREVNDKLSEDPGLINRSCYEKGWITKIEISDKDEISNLMNASEYEKLLESLEEKE